jgi:predicted enzyme related to lactoylglutathione lyase
MDLGFPSWVGVVCEDLEDQRRFYEDILGMRVVGEGDDWIHFDLGTGPEFELVRRSTEPQYDGVRYQVGFAVDDIEAARRELIARGVTPISAIQGIVRRRSTHVIESERTRTPTDSGCNLGAWACMAVKI